MSKNKLYGEISTSQLGIGRVVIPSDMDRDQYIKSCSELDKVYINVKGKGVIPVRVGKSIKNDIDYPDNPSGFGSSIMFVRLTDSNAHFGFEVFSDNNDVSEAFEGIFLMKKSIDGKTVMVSGDAKSGVVSIISDSGEKSEVLIAATEGSVNVRANKAAVNSNEYRATVFDLIRFLVPNSGDEDPTILEYKKGSGLSYSDEFGNSASFKDGEVNIVSKLINLGSGDEPLILGDSLVEFLDKLLTAISNILVATSLGSQPILNKAEFEGMKEDLEGLKSEVSKTE